MFIALSFSGRESTISATSPARRTCTAVMSRRSHPGPFPAGSARVGRSDGGRRQVAARRGHPPSRRSSRSRFMGGIDVVTPLYPLYQRAFGFSEVTLTLVYATVRGGQRHRAAGLRAGLRPGRPQAWGLLPALGFATVSALLLFLFAQGTAWLYLGRLVIGLAVGILSGTGTAWLAKTDTGRAGGRRRRSPRPPRPVRHRARAVDRRAARAVRLRPARHSAARVPAARRRRCVVDAMVRTGEPRTPRSGRFPGAATGRGARRDPRTVRRARRHRVRDLRVRRAVFRAHPRCCAARPAPARRRRRRPGACSRSGWSPPRPSSSAAGCSPSPQ